MNATTGYVLFAVGFLLFSSGSLLMWLGNQIFSDPTKFSAQGAFPLLGKDQLDLLKYFYQLLTKNNMEQLVIGQDGEVSKSQNSLGADVNVIEEFFHITVVQENNKQAFRKLLLSIPDTYLKQIPETRFGSPYVITVTNVGKEYVNRIQE